MEFYLIFIVLTTHFSLFVECNNNNFVEELLAEQNRLRAIHNAPALKLDHELNGRAEVMAKQAAERGGFQGVSKETLRNANTEMICDSFGEGKTPDGKVKDIAQAWYVTSQGSTTFIHICLYLLNLTPDL